MRSVLALAAVAAFAAWSGSADAFGGKKNRGCCGDNYVSSCCGYGYGHGGCSWGGGYGGCSYGGGYGCSAVVYAQPVAQAAPAAVAAPAPAQQVHVVSHGCSAGWGYSCSHYHGGGWGCSGYNNCCGYDYGCNGNGCWGKGRKNKGRKCCR
jgi:hypothetical protein